MTRNTKILSDKELFEKTKGIVEHAINAKINLTFRTNQAQHKNSKTLKIVVTSKTLLRKLK